MSAPSPFFACQPTENKKDDDQLNIPLDEALETKAIMKVFENETQSFFEGHYEWWASQWSHAAYTLQAWNKADGSSTAPLGWDKINA